MAQVMDAFERSVAAAIADGSLDAEKCGALIEAARKVATMLDDPDWPIVRGKLDNVSPSVFLKYCDALGITPDVKPEKAEKPKATKLAVMVNKSKFAKAANA